MFNYIGFHEYEGIIVPEEDAFEYAKSHLDELSDEDKQGFVDWFFSGAFIKEENQMYIPEFWCGVGATVITIVIAIFAYAFYLNKTEGDDDETT